MSGSMKNILIGILTVLLIPIWVPFGAVVVIGAMMEQIGEETVKALKWFGLFDG